MERCLAQPRRGGGGGGLVLPQQGYGIDLVDFPGDILPSLRSRWKWGGGKWEERMGSWNWHVNINKLMNNFKTKERNKETKAPHKLLLLYKEVRRKAVTELHLDFYCPE